jgi:hypothetical protein
MQNDPKATALMNSLQLSGSGRTVKLSFAVPSEVLDMLPIKKGIEGGGHHLDELKELHAAPWAPKPPTPPVPPTPDK